MESDGVLAVWRLARSASVPPEKLSIGARVGRYEIVGEPLGRGGSADVYPATEVASGGRFALKWARADVPDVARVFAEERHKARLLNHRHILVAHDGGEHDGRAYLVFRQLEGHLTPALRRERYTSPEAILDLMRKVVSAVALAHDRAVLHCDLKPSNILFDEAGEPHVADFGLARTLGASDSAGKGWGTDGWMSPEQVAQHPLGMRSDVFTLGVLLYWLLAGEKLPFGRGNGYTERVLGKEPEPLPSAGRFAGTLAWDLAAICRRALEKAPGQRYASGAELLRDLERAATGRLPTAGEQGLRAGRLALRWVRRQRLLALVGLTALSLPVYALSVQNEALKELRAALRPQSRFSAVAQARAVLSELYGMALRVDAMARDPKVVALLQHGGIEREAPALQAHAAGFDSVNVFSVDGTHQARWPVEPKGTDVDVSHADHFQCARRLAQELLARPRPDADPALPVCVARAHRSRLDHKVKLGMSVPLLVSGRLVGVVEGSTMARDRFGALQMSCGPGDCFTALLGPRDREVAGEPLPTTLSILSQHGLRVGGEQRLPGELSRRICESVGCAPDALRPFGASTSEPLELDLYRDPLSGASALAVVAPVARTGLSVLIATPYSAAHAKLADVARAAYRRSWLPLLGALVAWLVLLFAPNPRWPWPTAVESRRA